MNDVHTEPQSAIGNPQSAPPARWVDGRGIRWTVDAAALPRLRGVAEALADPALRPVREIPSRAHFRLPPAGSGAPRTFVKLYRLLGWPRRLRHAVRPVPAEVEWTVARALAPHGLSVFVPWAWGVRLRCGIPLECYLVADDLGEIPTLEEWIREHRRLPGRAFRGALAGLARTLRRLHDLGYFHGDPHQRNIVPLADSAAASPERPGGLRWTFLDFQQARRARLTAPYRRLRDLGRVFHGVRLDLGRFQRAHLLRAYLGAGARLPRRLFRLLEAITLYYEFRLLRRRARRCLTITDHFRRTRAGRLVLWHVAAADAGLIAARVREPAGAEDPTLAVRALPGRGQRAWLRAHALLARGLPTPQPLAWAVDENRGQEFLVTRRVEGAVPLESALGLARGPSEAADILRAVGAALRSLHDLGAFRGAAADGILAVRESSGEGGAWRALWAQPETFRFRPWVGPRARRRDVARLAAGLGRAAPGLPEDAWRAFLSAYLSPGAPAARADALWRLIRQARKLGG